MRHLILWATLPLLAADPSVEPGTMPRMGQVSPRFQSYNIEMVEVTGGRFWAPYKKAAEAKAAATSQPTTGVPGIDPSLFFNRSPIDLSNARLRKLASALGPAYVRVSGTWANSTFFHDSKDPAPTTPPSGFGGILTRDQWRGVVEFSKAVDAPIVTSFAISGGVRDDSGVWTPKQANLWLTYTKSLGGTIAAAEFFNEPSFASIGGAPKDYDAKAYSKDFARFRQFLKSASPKTILLGPGSVGDRNMSGGPIKILPTESLLTATGPGVDAFSYHFYGGVSQRCAGMGAMSQTTPAAALTEKWLSQTSEDTAFYAKLRDKYEPGKPLWLTETGETACGGNPWAATFLDTFRYLDQLGRLAQQNVQVVAHNTLVASDYALIDEETLTPRPSYWAAVLWSRLMGTTVLNPGPSQGSLHLYAHCQKNSPGGVTLLAINTDRDKSHALVLPGTAQHYALSSTQGLEASTIHLNGTPLTMGSNDTLPTMTAKPIQGTITMPPATIHFLTFPQAQNPACR